LKYAGHVCWKQQLLYPYNKVSTVLFTASGASATARTSRDRTVQLIPEIDFVFPFGTIERSGNQPVGTEDSKVFYKLQFDLVSTPGKLWLLFSYIVKVL